jgi:tetratricopeptide (TPR) repeat protein
MNGESKMDDLVRRFNTMTIEMISSQPDTAYNDYDLIRVWEHFEYKEDLEHCVAIGELILRSPEHSELVDYEYFYNHVVFYHRTHDHHQEGLRWAYAWLAYIERNALHKNRRHIHRILAETYLDMGDINTGLEMYTRRLLSDLDDLYTYYGLAVELPEAGLPNLGLKAAERALMLKSHPHFDRFEKELQEICQELNKTLEESPALTEVDPDISAAFQKALTGTVGESGAFYETEPYLPPVTQLLDDAPSPAVIEQIHSQGKLLAPELIRVAFDAELQDGPAPEHAITLLRRLQPELVFEFEMLQSWLAQADGNWYHELLCDLTGKINGFSTEDLQSLAANPEHNQSLRHSAVEDLGRRALKIPEQRQAIIDFFKSMLTRPLAQQASEETVTGTIILMALDLDARELYPDIKTAFDEDRVDPTMINLVEIHEKWGLPPIQKKHIPGDHLNLLLECTACSRLRYHLTQYVLVTNSSQRDESRFDNCILDHKVICPKCGAEDRYKLSTQAQFTLFAPRDEEAIRALANDEIPSSPPVYHPSMYFIKTPAKTRNMHPFDALAEYQFLLTKKPGNAKLHLGYANMLRMLFRYENALDEYRTAYSLDRNDPEIVTAYAMAEHDFGDRQTARQLYERVLSMQAQETTNIKALLENASESKEMMVGATAVMGLDRLNLDQDSPWEGPAYNVNNEPVPLKRDQDERSPKRRRRKRSRKRRK